VSEEDDQQALGDVQARPRVEGPVDEVDPLEERPVERVHRGEEGFHLGADHDLRRHRQEHPEGDQEEDDHPLREEEQLAAAALVPPRREDRDHGVEVEREVDKDRPGQRRDCVVP